MYKYLRVIFHCLHPFHSYHEPIEIHFTYQYPGYNSVKTKNKYILDYSRTDVRGFNEYLSSINWNYLFNSCNVLAATDLFYDVLWVGIDNFVPLIAEKCSVSSPVWYTRCLLKLKNRKKKAYAKYAKSLSSRDYRNFSKLRKEFLNLQNAAYNSYINRIQDNFKLDPKSFWKFVSSKKKSSTLPSAMYYKDRKSINMQDSCNLFAQYFSDVYISNDNIIDETFVTDRSEFLPIGSIHLSKRDIFAGLLYMKKKRGTGPDNIAPCLLVDCAQSLVHPLYYLFNLSLVSGVFPNRWKVSYVTPIFKCGPRSDICNYRGIAILPTIGKLFESLITDALTAHFHKVISPHQHGFVKCRSINTNLIQFCNKVINDIESGAQVDVIYTDFSKAFDRVHHKCLLNKLETLGMHSSLLLWIGSYLCDRQQYVRISGFNSHIFNVGSGVPQGSHLGPLLFILFINDVCSAIKFSNCLLYADDLKIFNTIHNTQDVINLQLDVNSVAAWCQANYMSLNSEKCKYMSIHRKRDPFINHYLISNIALARVTKIRDLGVIINEKLDFSEHIDYAIGKSYGMLGFVKRICAEFHDIDALKSVYTAHVRSHLEFASIVWSPSYDIHINRIESIQKKFVMFALRKKYNRSIDYVLPPYLDRCQILNIHSLGSRRELASILFIYDLIMGHIDAPDLLALINFNVPPRILRNSEFLRIDTHRTNYGNNEPITRMSRSFNFVSSQFDFNLSRYEFVKSVRSHDFQ